MLFLPPNRVGKPETAEGPFLLPERTMDALTIEEWNTLRDLAMRGSKEYGADPDNPTYIVLTEAANIAAFNTGFLSDFKP